MAKRKNAKPHDFAPRIENRRARFEYAITEKLECGIVLTGTEVKSIRLGQVSLAEGWAEIDTKSMQLNLHGVDIAPYPHAGAAFQHTPKQSRRLLAHKREINRLLGKAMEKGTTLVPLAIYFVRGRAKVEIGVAKGKRQHDKREDIKKRESDRDIRRAMTRQVL